MAPQSFRNVLFRYSFILHDAFRELYVLVSGTHNVGLSGARLEEIRRTTSTVSETNTLIQFNSLLSNLYSSLCIIIYS